ncbi:MAG: hypothetical protein IKP46_09460 [Bacteroidales bacterium]|nr:hypothetical protein [Bacteroidales bacterium]
MAEEINRDPRDLDGDGKVTLEEKIKYAASKATEKLNEVAGNLKEKGENLAEKAKGKLEGLKK